MIPDSPSCEDDVHTLRRPGEAGSNKRMSPDTPHLLVLLPTTLAAFFLGDGFREDHDLLSSVHPTSMDGRRHGVGTDSSRIPNQGHQPAPPLWTTTPVLTIITIVIPPSQQSSTPLLVRQPLNGDDDATTLGFFAVALRSAADVDWIGRFDRVERRLELPPLGGGARVVVVVAPAPESRVLPTPRGLRSTPTANDLGPYVRPTTTGCDNDGAPPAREPGRQPLAP